MARCLFQLYTTLFSSFFMLYVLVYSGNTHTLNNTIGSYLLFTLKLVNICSSASLTTANRLVLLQHSHFSNHNSMMSCY